MFAGTGDSGCLCIFEGMSVQYADYAIARPHILSLPRSKAPTLSIDAYNIHKNSKGMEMFQLMTECEP